MAGKLIGHTTCPECGGVARVTETEKCLYRYCPADDCRSGYHAKTPSQRAALMRKVQPVEGAPIAAPVEPEPKAVTAAPLVKAEKKQAPATPFGGLFR